MISSASDTVAPEFTVTDGEGNPVSFDEADGGTGIEVEAGTYTIKVTKKGHLSYTKKNVTVADLSAPIDVELVPGDINADDAVDELDLGSLLMVYGEENADNDINGDGNADELDLGSLLMNYGATAIVE